MKLARSFAAAAALLVLAGSASADSQEELSPLHKEVLASIADARGKILELAEAMPDKKYSWRPGKGVRSVSEVAMHVTASNYFLANMIGTSIPEGMDPMKFESTVTEKAQVLEALKKSFDHVEGAIKALPASSFDETVKTPFGEMSKRAVMLLVVRHADEHLGQSIAYARMNGVPPPWTAKNEAAAKGGK